MNKTGIEELNEKEAILDVLASALEGASANIELQDSIRRLKLGIEDLKGIYAFANHEYETKGQAPILLGKLDIKATKESLKEIQKQAKLSNKKQFSVLEILNKERCIVSSFVDHCFEKTKGLAPLDKESFIKNEIASLFSFQKKFDEQIKPTQMNTKNTKVVSK